jgi:hypothetical protein
VYNQIANFVVCNYKGWKEEEGHLLYRNRKGRSIFPGIASSLRDPGVLSPLST